MTLSQKLQYVVNAVNKFVENAKNIGQLESYDLQRNEEEAYIAIFVPNDNKTLKIDLDDFIDYYKDFAIQQHNHTIEEVESLQAKLFVTIEDTNNNEWDVKKGNGNVDLNEFENKDIIEGWVDGANQKHWFKGIIIDDNFLIPADIGDASKVFKINEMQIL